jgi:hypothetical protein
MSKKDRPVPARVDGGTFLEEIHCDIMRIDNDDRDPCYIEVYDIRVYKNHKSQNLNAGQGGTLTIFLTPPSVLLPFKCSWNIVQVADQRKPLRSWRKRKGSTGPPALVPAIESVCNGKSSVDDGTRREHGPGTWF